MANSEKHKNEGGGEWLTNKESVFELARNDILQLLRADKIFGGYNTL
jgi:hypothetical protein